MNLLGEVGLGILLFSAMAVQGAFMLFCTGRFIQITPEGSGLVMAANLWNTLILLLFIPLVAILLISGHYLGVDLSHVAIGSHLLLLGIEAAGILLILFGTVLVVLGFLVLRKNFQPGGFVPRESDQLTPLSSRQWLSCNLRYFFCCPTPPLWGCFVHDPRTDFSGTVNFVNRHSMYPSISRTENDSIGRKAVGRKIRGPLCDL